MYIIGMFLLFILGIVIGYVLGIGIGMMIMRNNLNEYKEERDRQDIITYTDID
jgi:uncharacterized membrane-anchored protein YhcB (DUF1043 family)